MEDETNQKPNPECDSSNVKILFIGNLKPDITNRWLEEYLRKTTNGFVCLVTLQPAAKKTKFALASFGSHNAAAEALLTLQGKHLGPQDTQIVVDFKKKKGGGHTNANADRRDRKQQVRKESLSGGSIKKGVPPGESKIIQAEPAMVTDVIRTNQKKGRNNNPISTGKSTMSARNGDTKQLPKTSKIKSTKLSVSTKDSDKSDNSVPDRERTDCTTKYHIQGTQKSSQNDAKKMRSQSNTNSVSARKASDTSEIKPTLPNAVLHNYPALQRFIATQDHPDTSQAANVSAEVSNDTAISAVEPNCILHIVSTDEDGVDLERLSEFVRRYLPNNPILGRDNNGVDVILEFSTEYYATHAYEILTDRPLSNSGGPITVKYASNTQKCSEMLGDQENIRDDADQDRIMRITSPDKALESKDFQYMLSKCEIDYKNLDVHHHKDQEYGTLALVELRSHDEAIEANRKMRGCMMGQPGTTIITEITSRRKRNRRRRNRKRPDKKNTPLLPEASSPDSSTITDKKQENQQQNDEQKELKPDGQDASDDNCSQNSQLEFLNVNNTSTSVLVRNIDRSITRNHIRSFLLENDIDTRGLQLFNSTGKRGSYAVVQFQYPEEAHDAWTILKEQPLGVLGDKIQVSFMDSSKRGKEAKRMPLQSGKTEASIGIASKSALSSNSTGEKQKQTIMAKVNSKKGSTIKASKTPSPTDVIIDDLPSNISESDIAEVVWKCPEEVRSGFKNSVLTGNRAVLDFKTKASAFAAVAELHFIRVKGHVLNAQLAVQNPDFDLLMFRKQREVLITHIKDVEKTINIAMETKMNDLAVEIAEVDNDLFLIDSHQQAVKLEEMKNMLQHKLDESQGFYEEFKQTAQDMTKQLDDLISDEPNKKRLTLGRLDDLCRRLEREGRRTTNPLPIYGSKTHILEVVTNPSTHASVIQAETGSGKSTQVPQYLIESILLQKNSSSNKCRGIICTQPRRVAAVTLAQRIAEEYGCEVGQEVGFIAGNKKKVSKRTLATFMTDRALLNFCLADSNYLDKYKYMIIDEAHERSVDTDILIAMLKKEQIQGRDITIIIMSATIDVNLFSRYFDGCPVVDIPGRTYPVDVEWCESSLDGQNMGSDNYLTKAVQKSYDIHRSEDIQGDILVFLTSQNEIERACSDLQRMLGTRTTTENDDEDVEVLPLHGKLQSHDQFKVFKLTREGKRKIVFATNIAETSVTIPGVKYVVDTGMVKELQYDARRNMSMLKVTTITQASAEQRKGRAGRTGPGRCYRLYSEEVFNDMEPTMKPEILRVHLGMAVIQLLQMGARDIEHFDFVESPEPGAIEQALKTLILLGAVKDTDRTLTDIGYQMSKLPLEPRLAKLILEGAKRKRLKDAIVMAALLSAPGNVYYQGGSDAERKQADQLKLKFCVEDGDVITMLGIYKEWYAIKGDKARNKWCKENSLNAKTLRMVQENVEELGLIIKRSKALEIKNNTKQTVVTGTGPKETKPIQNKAEFSKETDNRETSTESQGKVASDQKSSQTVLSTPFLNETQEEQPLQPKPIVLSSADDVRDGESKQHTATTTVMFTDGDQEGSLGKPIDDAEIVTETYIPEVQARNRNIEGKENPCSASSSPAPVASSCANMKEDFLQDIGAVPDQDNADVQLSLVSLSVDVVNPDIATNTKKVQTFTEEHDAQVPENGRQFAGNRFKIEGKDAISNEINLADNIAETNGYESEMLEKTEILEGPKNLLLTPSYIKTDTSDDTITSEDTGDKQNLLEHATDVHHSRCQVQQNLPDSTGSNNGVQISILDIDNTLNVLSSSTDLEKNKQLNPDIQKDILYDERVPDLTKRTNTATKDLCFPALSPESDVSAYDKNLAKDVIGGTLKVDQERLDSETAENKVNLPQSVVPEENAGDFDELDALMLQLSLPNTEKSPEMIEIGITARKMLENVNEEVSKPIKQSKLDHKEDILSKNEGSSNQTTRVKVTKTNAVGLTESITKSEVQDPLHLTSTDPNNDSSCSEKLNNVEEVKQDSSVSANNDNIPESSTADTVKHMPHSPADLDRAEIDNLEVTIKDNLTENVNQTVKDSADLTPEPAKGIEIASGSEAGPEADLVKTMTTNTEKFEDGDSQQVEQKECDPNETLRKILMASYFENLSVFSGHIRVGYTVASQLKTAVFHPSSALAALNSRPEWVIYVELRRTTKDFLCVVTPVDINWINELAPVEFSQHIEKVKTCVMSELKFNAIGTAIMKTLSKRRFEYVRNLEDDITKKAGVPCIIEVKVNDGNLVVFIASHSKVLATEIVEKSLQDIKTESRRERIEVPVGVYGSVRQVVTAGGETAFVLMNEDEYMSVEWSGVFEDISEDELQQRLQTIGFDRTDIGDVFKFPKHWNVAKQGKWGKVSFVSPDKARQAVEDGFMIEPDGVVNVQPVLPDVRSRGHSTGSNASASINTKIAVTWFTGRSKGHAFVNCETYEDAMHVIAVTDNTLLGGRYIIRCKPGKKSNSSIFVFQLDTDVTDDMLKEHITSRTSTSIQNVFIPREKAVNHRTDAVYKRHLRRLFRDVSNQVEVNVLPERGAKRKAFITFEPNLRSSKRRALRLLLGKQHKTTDGEVYRMEVIITCDLFCSQQVYRSVKHDVSRSKRESVCAVDIEDTKKTPADKRIHIYCDDYHEVEHLKNRLQALLCAETIPASSLVTDEVSPMWIDKVMTRLREQHLKDILKKNKAHADVNIRRQTIQIYGKESDVKSLKSDLSKYFTLAASTMFREVDIARRSGGEKGRAMRALVRQYGPWLEELKRSAGVDNITVDLKRGILLVDGSDEAYNSLESKVDDCLKGLTNPGDRGAVVADCEECGVCFCVPSEIGSKPYRLAACGHFFCAECLKYHLKQSSISKNFPIACPECEESIMLCDIKIIYHKEDEQQNLFRSGLDAYVAQNHGGDVKSCPGPDCRMVYRKDEHGGTKECEECAYCFCAGCGEQPHPSGMSCKEFRVSKKEFDDIALWMQQSGADAKRCPKCNVVIEKNDGCNRVACTNCKSHICWKCDNIYETAARCYKHLGLRHGGVFDVPADALDIPVREDPYDIGPQQVRQNIEQIQARLDQVRPDVEPGRALPPAAVNQAGVNREAPQARQAPYDIGRPQPLREEDDMGVNREAPQVRQAPYDIGRPQPLREDDDMGVNREAPQVRQDPYDIDLPQPLWEDDDIELWMQQSGADAKRCPKCKVVIEKNGGCNYVSCPICKSYICWKCEKFYDTARRCCRHLSLRHGGAFDVPDDLLDIPVRQNAHDIGPHQGRVEMPNIAPIQVRADPEKRDVEARRAVALPVAAVDRAGVRVQQAQPKEELPAKKCTIL